MLVKDLKADLICNETLAQLADRYCISDQLKASDSAFYVTREQVKTRGSLFESWVAGVFYSFLKHGPPRPPTALFRKQEDERKPQEGDRDAAQGGASRATPPTAAAANEKHQIKETHNQHSLSKEPTFNKGVRRPSENHDTSSDSSKSSRNANSGTNSSDENFLSLVTPLSPSRKKPVLTGWMHASSSPKGSASSTTSTRSRSEPSPIEIKQFKSPTDDRDQAATGVSHGQAYDYLYAWLGPLFTPLAHHALRCRVMEKAKAYAELNSAQSELDDFDDAAKDNRLATGAKAVLEIFAVNKLGVQPEYVTVRAEGFQHMWLTTCTVTKNNGEVLSV